MGLTRDQIKPALFQSTPPARGATKMYSGQPTPILISIHAPREGGDVVCFSTVPLEKAFQSTPPARGATTAMPHQPHKRAFQSTPPARGATSMISRYPA